MPWIKNISLGEVKEGLHSDPRNNTILIQIVDPDISFPVPKFKFSEIYQFKFLDLEENDECEESLKISDEQAEDLVQILNNALMNDKNVIVHCVMGVCRSGAVAEVGIMMGFIDTYTYRNPNTLVKKKMMKVLGWTYD